jgi:SAM-dependent methyltransferase
MSRLKGLLRQGGTYIALQRIIGADKLRYICIDQLDLAPGNTVADVGCGPAYYLDRLPKPLNYHGFDTEPRYIDWARKRWGETATFHLGVFGSTQASELAPIDAVLLLGILHHLSDEESLELLEFAAQSVAPSGRVVTVDTCFEPSQGRISRWMARNDRGEYVREPGRFMELARTHFQNVAGELLSGVTRIPGSYWMMTMSDPRPDEPSAGPRQ